MKARGGRPGAESGWHDRVGDARLGSRVAGTGKCGETPGPADAYFWAVNGTEN